MPGSMALVPVMLQCPDGSVTHGFQLQPVPSFPQDVPLPDAPGSYLQHGDICLY